jgi:hypothetical protein
MALHPFRHLGRSKIHRYLPLFGAIYRYPSDSPFDQPGLSRTQRDPAGLTSSDRHGLPLFRDMSKIIPDDLNPSADPVFRFALKTVAIIHPMSGLSTPRPARGVGRCIPKLLVDFLYRRLPSLLSRGFPNPQAARQIARRPTLPTTSGCTGRWAAHPRGGEVGMWNEQIGPASPRSLSSWRWRNEFGV